VVPGTPGAIATYEEVDRRNTSPAPTLSLFQGEAFVKEHGLPAIIKAAYGGGGRGMRVVWKQEDFKDAFERAVSEATSAFGNGTVFIERFLHKPRHIEVQLLGDSEGNIVHLYEVRALATCGSTAFNASS
jgi:pyruvate carboxylase